MVSDTVKTLGTIAGIAGVAYIAFRIAKDGARGFVDSIKNAFNEIGSGIGNVIPAANETQTPPEESRSSNIPDPSFKAQSPSESGKQGFAEQFPSGNVPPSKRKLTVAETAFLTPGEQAAVSRGIFTTSASERVATSSGRLVESVKPGLTTAQPRLGGVSISEGERSRNPAVRAEAAALKRAAITPRSPISQGSPGKSKK